MSIPTAAAPNVTDTAVMISAEGGQKTSYHTEPFTLITSQSKSKTHVSYNDPFLDMHV